MTFFPVSCQSRDGRWTCLRSLQLQVFLVLLRWTPVCWAALGCWTRPLSSAALRPTRFLPCSRRPRAPRTTWSSPASSGPPTAMSSLWPTMARSTASWFKPHLYLYLQQSPRCCMCETWTCFRVFASRQNLRRCSVDSVSGHLSFSFRFVAA